MNNLIFRKLSADIFYFFLTASLTITLIVWVVQAVNFLDIISEDGYSIKVYFAYTVLSLPKIFSRILIFIFFISYFYILIKYEDNNEILVFWTNGIKKINLINFLFRYSVIFLFVQYFLTLFLVPYSQNISRIYLKNANIDFLPSLISEKKFINVFKNLTIFIEQYDQNGKFTNIYLNENIDNLSSKIIMAQTGKIQKRNNFFSLKLFDGTIIDSNSNNSYKINFKETEYDLSRFSTNTVTSIKIQQINSKNLILCAFEYYQKNEINNKYCLNRKIDSVLEESYKRMIIPLYIFILSLISCCLLIKPKNYNLSKYYNWIVFISGFVVIILSQVAFKFLLKNFLLDGVVILFPILLVIFFYLTLLIKKNFKLRYL